MIGLHGVQMCFGRKVTLDGLTFMVPPGQVFGLVGPAGAGKTTTLRVLAGLLRPDAGTATIAGVSVATDRRAVQKLIGYMPELFGMYRGLTAQEHLEFYAGIHGVSRRRRPLLARELLEVLGFSDRRGDDIERFSRGEKRRLCLARTLVHDPPVLLLDEPMAGLDCPSQVEVRELLGELGRMGKTVLISSHLVTDLEGICTWMGLLDAGRMVVAGPVVKVRGQLSGERRVRIDLIDGNDAAAAAGRLVGRFAGMKDAVVREGEVELVVDDSSRAVALSTLSRRTRPEP